MKGKWTRRGFNNRRSFYEKVVVLVLGFLGLPERVFLPLPERKRAPSHSEQVCLLLDRGISRNNCPDEEGRCSVASTGLMTDLGDDASVEDVIERTYELLVQAPSAIMIAQNIPRI